MAPPSLQGSSMLLFQFFLVRIHILVRSLEHVRHSMILLRIIQSDPGGYDIPGLFLFVGHGSLPDRLHQRFPVLKILSGEDDRELIPSGQVEGERNPVSPVRTVFHS